MKRLLLAGLLLVVAPVATLSAQNWDATVAETARGHKVGKPDAPVKLIAFVSYSCPHCAHFEMESDAPLRLAYIQPGKASLEVRNVLRNPIDLAAALVAECGPDDKYFGNMRAIFRAQDRWMQVAVSASAAQQQRWTTGTVAARMKTIAADLDFYELMEARGYTIAQLDRCLSDQAAIDGLVARAQADRADFTISGTPSFAINGTLLPGVSNWTGLNRALEAASTR